MSYNLAAGLCAVISLVVDINGHDDRAVIWIIAAAILKVGGDIIEQLKAKRGE